jgi:hypothetical protein
MTLSQLSLFVNYLFDDVVDFDHSEMWISKKLLGFKYIKLRKLIYFYYIFLLTVFTIKKVKLCYVEPVLMSYQHNLGVFLCVLCVILRYNISGQHFSFNNVKNLSMQDYREPVKRLV